MTEKNIFFPERWLAPGRKRHWAVPCLVVLILLGGFEWMHKARQQADELLRQQLLNRAAAVARTINPEQLQNLSFTDGDVNRPEFQRLCFQMRAYAEAVGLRSLYSMALRDGQIVFGPESLPADDPYASSPGTVYKQPSPQDFEIFKSGKASVQGPRTDEYGTFVTALAPVLDPRTGSVLLVIGLDEETSEWRAALLRAQRAPLLFTAGLLAILLAGSLLTHKYQRTDGSLQSLRYAEAIASAAVMLMLTLAAVQVAHDAERRHRYQIFTSLAQAQVSGIAGELAKLRTRIISAKLFFESGAYMDHDKFGRYANRFTETGFTQGWVWVPEVAAADASRVEQEAHRTGATDFAIWQKNAQGAREPAAGRDRLYPALYIEPQAEFRGASGYDWGSEPVRRAAIEETLRTGLPVITAPEASTAPTNELSGLFVMQSVQTATQTGVVAIALRPDKLLLTQLYKSGAPETEISADLFQLECGTPPRFLASSSDKCSQACWKHHAGLSLAMPVFIFGRSYVVLVHPEHVWLATHPLRNGWRVGAAGLMLTALLTAFIALLSNRPVQLEREVQRRTMELRESEEKLLKLSAAINHTAEAVVITNTAGIIEYVNPAFEVITGYLQEEAVGQNPRVLKSGKQDAAFYRNLWQTISSGRIWEGRIINKRKDGTLYTEEASISPVFDPNGVIVNYVAVKRDITDELNKEEQFRQSDKMQAVGQLAGGVSHDFNNMLQAILGFSELLLDGLKAETLEHQLVSEIKKAALRAVDLTRQLLTFSRKQPIEKKRLDMNAIIRDVNVLLHMLLGVDVTRVFDLAEDLSPVDADPGQMTQVVMNLAINARDAMPNGGRLSFATKNITFEPQAAAAHGAESGSFVCLSVTDTGSGMSPEVKAHLFEPFFTTKAVGKGTGLGLAVVFGIVKQNKGWIHVYSEEGHGTTFNIYLPACEAAAPDKRAVCTHNGRILLAEDDTDMRNLVIQSLKPSGFEFVAASSAEEALELFKQEKGRFDLLFSDIGMPGKSGIELADALRAEQPGLPVLLFSGYQDQRKRWAHLESKGYFFLQKPFNIADLLAAVHSALTEKTR